MKETIWDIPKTEAMISRDMGRVCKVDGCGSHVSYMQGPGMSILCRDHQLMQREYGGQGRADRLWTFHRTWDCAECGYNSLEDPRLQDIEDEMTKRRVARVLMHGDHIVRKADGGDNSAGNIRSLCFVCHAKKTILSEDYKK